MLTAAALVGLSVQAQTLPSPPVSPAPVANYEYDANGKPTRVIQAPGVSGFGFGFATATTYDRTNRARNTTDARKCVMQRDYNGHDDHRQVTDPGNLLTSYQRNRTSAWSQGPWLPQASCRLGAFLRFGLVRNDDEETPSGLGGC